MFQARNGSLVKIIALEVKYGTLFVIIGNSLRWKRTLVQFFFLGGGACHYLTNVSKALISIPTRAHHRLHYLTSPPTSSIWIMPVNFSEDKQISNTTTTTPIGVLSNPTDYYGISYPIVSINQVLYFSSIPAWFVTKIPKPISKNHTPQKNLHPSIIYVSGISTMTVQYSMISNFKSLVISIWQGFAGASPVVSISHPRPTSPCPFFPLPALPKPAGSWSRPLCVPLEHKPAGPTPPSLASTLRLPCPSSA